MAPFRWWAQIAVWLCASACFPGHHAILFGAAGPQEFGETEYIRRQWNRNTGLASDEISALFQDSKGYLWVGTDLSLCRFDGLKWTTFSHLTDREFESDHCTAFAESGDGTLWIGTKRGLIARTKGVFRRFTGHPLITQGGIVQIHWSKRSGLWVLGGSHILRQTAEGFRELPFDEKIYRYSICESADGTIWVGTERGLVSIDPTTGQCREFHSAETNRPRAYGIVPRPDGSIYALMATAGGRGVRPYLITGGDSIPLPGDEHEDARHNNFAVADHSGQGIWRVAPGKKIQRFIDGKRRGEALEIGDFPLCVLSDRERNIWVGTEGSGLFCFVPKPFRALTPEAPLSESVAAIWEARDEAVWVGTEAGLARYRDSSGMAGQYAITDGLPREDVRALAEDSTGKLWIGTGKGLALFGTPIEPMIFHGPAKYGDPEDVSRNKVRAIAEVSAGQIIVGTEYGLYSVGKAGFATIREGKDDDIPDVRALCGDGAGNLWVGSFREGLTLYSNRKFLTISTTESEREPIWTIYKDGDGVVWFGGERGLKWLENKAVRACTAEHGLPANIINQIVDDDLGYLWLGLEKGICRVAKRELKELSQGKRDHVNPVFFDESDGMPSSEMAGQRSQPAAIKRRKGDLWFATAKGVAIVDPRQIEEALRGPRVVVESLRASDHVLYQDERMIREKDPAGVLTIPAGLGGILEMHFTANTFIASEKCRFKFRLDGYDTDWHDAGDRRIAFYTNLSPGRYRFRVQAGNHRNVWTEDEATLAFVLAPFYYQTWSFRISNALMLAAVVFGIHHYRVRHLRQLEQLEGKLALANEKNRLAQDLHDGIGSALTQLRLLAALAERQQAKANGSLETIRKIGSLSHDLNHHLREIVWLARLESQTVEGVLLRAAEQAEEMAKAAELKCSIDLPPRIPEIHLPAATAQSLYFAIKEALNNAVKHARARSISFKAAVEASVLRVSISDDGEGIRAQESRGAAAGLGLRGMRERLNKMDGECLIRTKEGIRILREKLPKTPILVYTKHDHGKWVFPALREGASGYVLKSEGHRLS